MGRLDQREPGDERRSARPRRFGRPREAARPASCRLAARRRCRPAGPRTSKARGSLAGGQRRPRAGDYRGGTGASTPLTMRRVGLEPTSPCGQWLLRPSPLPVWTPPRPAILPTLVRPAALLGESGAKTSSLASNHDVRALHAHQPGPGEDPGALRARRVGEARGGAALQHRAHGPGAGDPAIATAASARPDGFAGASSPVDGPSGARARR